MEIDRKPVASYGSQTEINEGPRLAESLMTDAQVMCTPSETKITYTIHTKNSDTLRVS